jgi:uncharacterized membrane protein
MKKHLLGADILIFAGLIAMLVGAIDPLHGVIIILPGSGLVALGAFVGKSQHRKLLYLAFAFVLLGVGAMAGVGTLVDSHGRSEWWTLSYLPYPAGWVMSLVGTIGKSRYRKLLFVAFILMAGGIGALLALDRGSMFFVLGISYPIGLILCLIATILMFIESLKNRDQ